MQFAMHKSQLKTKILTICMTEQLNVTYVPNSITWNKAPPTLDMLLTESCIQCLVLPWMFVSWWPIILLHRKMLLMVLLMWLAQMSEAVLISTGGRTGQIPPHHHNQGTDISAPQQWITDLKR
jgi:hypothetical protein